MSGVQKKKKTLAKKKAVELRDAIARQTINRESDGMKLNAYLADKYTKIKIADSRSGNDIHLAGLQNLQSTLNETLRAVNRAANIAHWTPVKFKRLIGFTHLESRPLVKGRFLIIPPCGI